MGDILYKLVGYDKDEATNKFGCKDGCVYKAEDHTDRFCFKDGVHPVTCLEEQAFHWCYEGDCGSIHWAQEYPVSDFGLLIIL